MFSPVEWTSGYRDAKSAVIVGDCFTQKCRIELRRKWILLPTGPDTAQTVEAQGMLFGALSIARANEDRSKSTTESVPRSPVPLLAGLQPPQLHGLPVRSARGALPGRSVRIHGCTYFRCG